MVGCPSPFASTVLSQRSTLVNPSISAFDLGGQLQIIATFPQAMDQASSPAVGDVIISDVDGGGQSPDFTLWTSPTTFEWYKSYSASFSNPLEVAYTKGANPFVVLSSSEEYDSFTDSDVPVT